VLRDDCFTLGGGLSRVLSRMWPVVLIFPTLLSWPFGEVCFSSSVVVDATLSSTTTAAVVQRARWLSVRLRVAHDFRTLMHVWILSCCFGLFLVSLILNVRWALSRLRLRVTIVCLFDGSFYYSSLGYLLAVFFVLALCLRRLCNSLQSVFVTHVF